MVFYNLDKVSKKCLHQLFEEQVERTPEEIAVFYEEENSSNNDHKRFSTYCFNYLRVGKRYCLSYKELNKTANRLAHYLRRNGIGREVLIPICVDRGLNMIISILGVLKAGGAYVPIDPNYPKQRIEHILKEINSPYIITQEKFKDFFCREKEIIVLDKKLKKLENEPTHNPSLDNLKSVNLAYVIYTSGSTGNPKGVMVEHKAIVNRLAWMQNHFQLSSSDKVLQKASYCFDVSIWELFLPVISGAKLIFANSEGHKDSDYLLDVMEVQKITILHFVPSALIHLLNELDPIKLCNLRLVICSGEILSRQLANKFLKTLPFCSLYNLYGPTEAAVDVSYWKCSLEDSECFATIPIGRAISKIELHVLDKNLQPASIGEIGELHIAGIGLARGYLNNPQLTKQKFVEDPFNSKDKRNANKQKREETRLYKTGDLVKKIDQKNLEFIGRIDNQVKLRGFRIELGEIESTLLNHSIVLQAAVVVGNNKGQKFLAAYYVTKEKISIKTDELCSYLEKFLPDYMIPAIFIPLSNLPLTLSGKTNRKKLQNRVLDDLISDKKYVSPQTKKEELLSEIWSKSLNLEKVGIREDFFALGGDSIISIRILALARERGLQITPKQFFSCRTIEELAELVRFTKAEKNDQCLVEGESFLSPIQTWFFEQKFHAPSNFTQVFCIKLRIPIENSCKFLENASLDAKTPFVYQHSHSNKSFGTSDLPVFNKKMLVQIVFNLIFHHDVLRLKYTYDKSHWKQCFSEEFLSLKFIESRIVEVVDLSNVPKNKKDQFVVESTEAFKKDLNIEKGPLIKFILYRNDNDLFSRLNIIAHHLIIDGISWRILLDDFGRIYRSIAKKEKIVLPPKASSFKDWVKKLQEYATSKTIQTEWQYWLKFSTQRFSKNPKDQTGRPYFGNKTCCLYGVHRKPKKEKNCSQYTINLTKNETQSLLNKVHFAYQTEINDILLSALMLAYSSWTGEHQLSLHLEGHGREQFSDDIDVTRTIGWFTSLFPVYLEIEEVGVEKVLKRVKEQLRSIPNKGFGYGILRYLSRDKRKLNLKCLDKTQILFNYLGQVDIDLHDEKLFSIDKTVWLDVFNDNNLSDSISIIAEIRNSNFFITFYFDQDLYAENSICAFANDFKLNLKKIITHCLCKTSKGFTPSDFPLAKLDQAALDDFTYETKGINSITNIETIYSLNPLQKGLLFHMLCDPNSDQYFTQITMEYVGELDQEKFKKSWEIIIAQHDILRTRFVWKGIKEPLQIVHKKIGMMWHEEDWSSKKTCEQDRHLNKFLCEDRKIGFDFNVPGLMRFSLIKLADNRYQFVWSHHHMILDGWCLPILLKELNETYKKLNSNRLRLDRNLDYLPNDLYSQKIPATYEDDFEYYASKKVPQYENYIDWLQQQPLDEAKIFWKNQLKDLREPISLSICKTLFKTHKPIENITIFNFYFSEKMTQEFRLYAKSCKITLNSLVKLAWITVLWKYSGQYDIVTGTTFSGRLPELSQVNEMIGLFINTLPTRLKIDSSKTVKEHLLILHDKIQKANQYSYLSLSEVHKCSDISPDVPLFSNLFIFDSYQLDKIPLSEKVLVNKVSIWEKTNYPLVLAVEPKEKLELSLSYDTKSFSKESIRRLSIHLKCALQWILKNPNNYLVQINILSNYERQLILRKSHGATIDYPKDLTLHEVFEQQATNFPNNIAVETNGQKFTYKELNEQSNSLANYIKKELKILDRTDIKEELIIGIYLGQGIDLLVSILAILKSGGAYLPLDIEYPKERLKFMTEDSNIQFILTKNIFQQRLTFLNKPLVCIDKKKCEIAQESLLNIKLSYNPRSLAYILYTSGSTGKPKGTMIEHLAVINRIAGLQQKYSLNTKDTILFYTSICFDVSITEIFWPLLTGAKIKIPSKDCHRDVNSLIEEIDMSKISYINFLPSFLHVFLESLKPKQCYSLKNVFVGVEELSAKTIHMFHNKLTANLYNAYGVTESVVDATHFNCSKKRISEKVPIGTPLPNTQTFILDQFLSMLPFGVAGELYIGGDSLARGYLNRSKLSSEKFIEKPSSFTSNSENNNKYLKKEYLYRTGDLARWREDGNLEFLGRFDNQIKIRGFRVELEEIEETLNRHENVIQSVLTSQTNDESVYLIAYYKSRNGTPIKLEKLQTYLENYLPAYMIPCMFVHLEHFPLTANGKVNRHALPKIDRKVNKKQIKPQTELEELLSVTWKDTLDLKQIDSNDNFFYSGGNSILAMRLISSLNQKTGLNLPVSWVFQYTTIKKQANCIKNRKGAAKYKPIICFNEKTNNSRSLFFVHPGFNGAEVYNKLAKYLDKHYSFFAIESYNLYSGKTMIESINELASLYIKNMKTIQPRGPYHLGGWCMGGLIAYEMASQLMKKNEKVSIVYLLDSFPGIPKELKKDFVSDQADRLLVESVVKFLSSKYKDRLKKLAFLEAKMVCSYEVKPYPGKVALFKAMKGNEGLSNINLIPSAFDKKWAKFVLKRDNDFGRYVKDLEVHSINCVHEDMSNLFFSKIISDLIVKSLT